MFLAQSPTCHSPVIIAELQFALAMSTVPLSHAYLLISASTYALFTNEDLRYCSGSCELLQVILNLIDAILGCDIDKFLKPLFEGQLTEELPSPSAVGAGWLDEHDQLSR